MVAGRNSMLTLLYPPLPSSTLLYPPPPSTPPRPAKCSHFCFRSVTSSSFALFQIFTSELSCSSHPKGGPLDDRVVAFPGLFHIVNLGLERLSQSVSQSVSKTNDGFQYVCVWSYLPADSVVDSSSDWSTH